MGWLQRPVEKDLAELQLALSASLTLFGKSYRHLVVKRKIMHSGRLVKEKGRTPKRPSGNNESRSINAERP